MTNYSEKSIEFIKAYYPLKGVPYCSKNVKELFGESISQGKIRDYCRALGIPGTRTKVEGRPTVDMFYNITDPRIAYLLGITYADGHLEKDGYSFHISLKSKDGWALYETIKNLAVFSHFLIKKNTENEQLKIGIYSKEICARLKELGYATKSQDSPHKVLSELPINLHRFFWLGYLDGDASYCKNKREAGGSLVFTGAINQDWTSLENFCNQMNCSYLVFRYTCEKTGHSRSNLGIYCQPDIIRISELLYKTYHLDNIGLKRKYETYLKIKELAAPRKNKSGYKGVREDKRGKFIYKFIANKVVFQKGGFNSALEAAIAHDRKIIEILGHRARTIFPISNYIDVGYSEIYS